MYKRPPKHIERLRLAALYSVMTLAVVGVVGITVMVVLNYGYNRDTGTFEQRGLVQFASTPSGASVEIDGVTISPKTPTKSSVEPGERSFIVKRDGYQPWKLTTSVDAGSMVWLNYARLVPTDPQLEKLYHYPTLAAAAAAPNQQSILLQLDAEKPSLRLLDISSREPAGKTLSLPESIYAPIDDKEQEAAKSSPVTFSLLEWDESSRYVLAWRTLGNDHQLLLIDTKQPEKSVNVSRTFSLSIDQAHFSGRSGNSLYVVSEGSLRKLNVSEGTISRSIAASVDKFTVHETNVVTYTTYSAENDHTRTAGVYRDGDDEATVLEEVENAADTSLSIASTAYYNATYTAISKGNNFTLYKGHYDRGTSGLEKIATREFDSAVESVEFNETDSHVLIRAGSSFASYDIDRKLFGVSSLASERAESKDLFWVDAMHVGLVVDGTLTMRDIDGHNIFEINEARDGSGVTLSRSGTYFYSFQNSENGVSLQRVKMIL